MYRKSGPYNLVKGVLTATMPSGMFLKMIGIDEDGNPEIEVWVHPDLANKIGGDLRFCGEETY